MSELESMTAANGHRFSANAKNYASERDAIIKFIDQIRANENCSGQAFAKWAGTCETDSIRSGLAMIAERESYHARVFERRLRDLGANPRAVEGDTVRGFHDYFGDQTLADATKLLRLTALFPKPAETVRPFTNFTGAIKDDVQTKAMLKLCAQNELSSATWLMESCAALNGVENAQSQ